MSEFQAHITRLHSDHSFEQFSRSINGELSDATTISLNPNFGRGFIRKLNPEPGVSVRLWNAILNQPARVFKHAIPRSANKGFNLVYILTPEHCQLKTISTHTQFIQFDTRVCYLLAEDVAYDFELSPFHPLQVVDCSITSAWLKEQFEKKVLPFPDFWERTIRTDGPFVLTDICSASVNQLVNVLVTILVKEKPDPGAANEIIPVLVNAFFKKAFSRQSPPVVSLRDVHFEKIMEAENILLAHLQKNLPSLESIARMVSLSESTFKRHFKAIFGKSIYEYYLEKKMDLARQLMIENTLNVNETAERLGYGKVSNFIEIFKKHHGYSPGALKKKRAQDKTE
ncbi:MAG: AraC family transcriptional regulator [Chitinophagaceae bacterium]|nr:MAG: AraC family transcriptional regulator [Chitinophagaceae bacterium]